MSQDSLMNVAIAAWFGVFLSGMVYGRTRTMEVSVICLSVLLAAYWIKS